MYDATKEGIVSKENQLKSRRVSSATHFEKVQPMIGDGAVICTEETESVEKVGPGYNVSNPTLGIHFSSQVPTKDSTPSRTVTISWGPSGQMLGRTFHIQTATGGSIVS